MNPWVIPRQDKYVIQQFLVYDRNGKATYYTVGKDGFYYEDNRVRTDMPVLSFHVLNNPRGDIVPPIIKAIRLKKSVYHPGENLVFDVAAKDDNSGVRTYCCGSLMTTFQQAVQGLNGSLRPVRPDAYELGGFPILRVPPPTLPVQVTFISISDNAANFGGLRLLDGERHYRSEPDGRPTPIEAMAFTIVR